MKSFLGLGTDIIEIERIESAVKKHGERFLETLFSEKERSYCAKYSNPYPHFAGRFAAKEAVLKALGTGLQEGLTWQDIEILNTDAGVPQVHLSKKLQKKFPASFFLLSISHCRTFATATAFFGQEVS